MASQPRPSSKVPSPRIKALWSQLINHWFPFVKAVLNPLFLAGVRWRMYINWLVISHNNMWSSKVERLAEVGYWARHSSHTSPSSVLAYFPYLGYHMTAPKKGLFCHQLGPLIDIVGDHIPIMAFDIVESIICKVNKKFSKMPNSLSGLFRSFLGFKIIALLKKWKQMENSDSFGKPYTPKKSHRSHVKMMNPRICLYLEVSNEKHLP